MSKYSAKTYVPKTGEIAGKWWIIDANGKNLGRMATRIATVLRGKNKPTFSPHVDTGDFVVVINAEKITMTGEKWTQKNYYSHSRYFGSLKSKSAAIVRDQKPEMLVEEAVLGMLPNNKLSQHLINKLKVYAGAQHPHASQKPEALTWK